MISDYGPFSALVLPSLPSTTKLIGPSFGAVSALKENISQFEAANSKNVGVLSQHVYGGYQETGQNFPPDYLLSPAALTDVYAGGADSAQSVAGFVTTAHSNQQKFRIDEMNSIDEGGIEGISDSFSSALWVIDQMFEFANVGVDGVNVMAAGPNPYTPIAWGRSHAGPNSNIFTIQQVNPLYYGELYFQDATATANTMLPVTVQSGTNNPNVKVWATTATSGAAKGDVYITILNKDESFTGNVEVSLPNLGTATAYRLIASSYAATTGVTFAGQTFDGTLDGTISGTQVTETYQPTNGVYSIPVQPAGAVMLLIQP